VLLFNDREVLKTVGTISHKQMEEQVKQVYHLFDNKRKEVEAKQADLDDLKLLEEKLKGK